MSPSSNSAYSRKSDRESSPTLPFRVGCGRPQGETVIQKAGGLDVPGAIFAAIGKFNRATKMKGHELNAVADAKNGNPKRKNRRI
jgi:hypothetical protein